MHSTLRDSKANLSALVERACAGEDVVITVRGRPRVRLCPVEDDRRFSITDFVRELESIQSRYRVSADSFSAEELVADLREDRV